MTMTNHEVLSVYAAMGELSGKMVQAAAAADWDGLETLEQDVAAHVRRLREQETVVVLNGAERQQKLELIKLILDHDRQVRDLTLPWMAQLSKLISSTGTERRLANAYGGA